MEDEADNKHLLDTPKSKGYNKYFVLFCGCLVQLWIGGLYTWGNETVYFTSWLRQYDPTLTYEKTLFTFGTATVALALGGVPGGLLLAKVGPRAVGLVGTVMYAGSVYLAVLIRSLTGLVLVYGVLRGTAIGIAHVPPLAVCALYFPGNVGFIQGVVATFFGLGGFVLNFVTTALVNPNNLSPIDDPDDPDHEYFPPDGEVVGRVVDTWLILASIFCSTIVAAFFLVNPPGFQYKIETVDTAKSVNATAKGEDAARPRKLSLPEAATQDETLIKSILGDDCEPGGTKRQKRLSISTTSTRRSSSDADSVASGGSSSSSDSLKSRLSEIIFGEKEVERTDWTLMQAIFHPQYILVCVLFILGTIPGHIALAMYKVHGPGDDAFLTLVGSFGAFANGAGRLFFGFCSDYAKEKTVLFSMFFLQIGFCMAYPYTVDDKASFTVVVLALHFLYGGNFAVFPALVWKQFGKTYFGSIYAVILAAWGLGGLAGDTLVNVIEEPLGQLWLFVTLAGISVVAAFFTLFLNSAPDETKRWRALFGMKPKGGYSQLDGNHEHDERLLKQPVA